MMLFRMRRVLTAEQRGVLEAYTKSAVAKNASHAMTVPVTTGVVGNPPAL